MGNKAINRLGAALVLACAVAGGCAGKPKVSVIQDPGPARLSKATELAAQAQRAYHDGKADEAIDLYRKSLEQSQELYFVWNNLGRLYMDKKNYMQAAEMFKSAADLAPGDPRPFYNLGVIYEMHGLDKDALDYFSRSLQRDSKYLPSLRGAVMSAKHMDLTDEESLSRVKTAIMLEANPQWRSLFEREVLRIQGTLGRRETVEPVQASQKELERRWRELQQGREQPSLAPEAPIEMPTTPVTSPAAEPNLPPPAEPQPQPIEPPQPPKGG